MIRSARRLLGSRPVWVKQLLLGMMIVLSIGAIGTLVIKQGLVRWPLKVATGPAMIGGPDFLNTVTKVFAEERPIVHLKRIKKESFAASAKALEDGEADLAIVRSDIAMPSNGLTIAILRRDNLVLIVPGNASLDSFQGLSGQKIGLLKSDSAERNEGLVRLLNGVLNFYNINPGTVHQELLTLDEIGPAIAKKQVAGILVLGPSGTGPVSKAIAAIGSASGTSPKLIGEKQAAAIAKTIQGTEANEIEEGDFGGAKPKPEEALNTLAVTFRLVGRHSLPDFATGEIARLLTLTKARLISTSPLARNIEAPDSEDGSGLPIHPGAAAYFEGEQNSLVDSAVSVFYLISITLGILGSCIVWLFSAKKTDAAAGGEIDIKRLADIMRNVRNADLTTLERMEDELDDLVIRSFDQGSALDTDQISMITIVTRQLEQRRKRLQASASSILRG